jgi:hypothetical protein
LGNIYPTVSIFTERSIYSVLVAGSSFAYYSTLKIDAVSSSETSNIYRNARRLTAEANTLRNTKHSVLQIMITKPSDVENFPRVTKLSEIRS